MADNGSTPPKGKKMRILLVEDHPIFRMGMTDLINQEKDMVVCGGADDVSGARKAVARLDPDMVVVDISLKKSNGLDLVREIHHQNRRLPVLVLSMHDEAVYAQRALRAGARGYIMKQEASTAVVQAIRRILNGGLYVSDRVVGSILGQVHEQGAPCTGPATDRLTDRELEVFDLIGRGLSTGRIADRLNLSVKTIGTYRERIKLKLALASSAELTRRAVLWVEKKNA